jgi:hypothetical protein
MFHILPLGGGLLSFVVVALIAVWVYNDAEKRGGSNSIIWAVGTFFCCPIVPIIYLIVRK